MQIQNYSFFELLKCFAPQIRVSSNPFLCFLIGPKIEKHNKIKMLISRRNCKNATLIAGYRSVLPCQILQVPFWTVALYINICEIFYLALREIFTVKVKMWIGFLLNFKAALMTALVAVFFRMTILFLHTILLFKTRFSFLHWRTKTSFKFLFRANQLNGFHMSRIFTVKNTSLYTYFIRSNL